MQILTEAKSTTKTNGTAGQNPLRVFEEYAKRIWESPQGKDDKCARLAKLGDTISDYTKKIDSLLANKDLDRWSQLSVMRSKVYLEQLANDVRMLASTFPVGN